MARVLNMLSAKICICLYIGKGDKLSRAIVKANPLSEM